MTQASKYPAHEQLVNNIKCGANKTICEINFNLTLGEIADEYESLIAQNAKYKQFLEDLVKAGREFPVGTDCHQADCLVEFVQRGTAILGDE